MSAVSYRVSLCSTHLPPPPSFQLYIILLRQRLNLMTLKYIIIACARACVCMCVYYILTSGRDLFALRIHTCVLLPQRMEEKYVYRRVIAFSFGGKKKWR